MSGGQNHGRFSGWQNQGQFSGGAESGAVFRRFRSRGSFQGGRMAGSFQGGLGAEGQFSESLGLWAVFRGAESGAVFSLALHPGGCCDHPVRPRADLTPSKWEAGSVCCRKGSVLVPKPLRTGIPGVGGQTGIPGAGGWTGIPGAGTPPAWVYELLVAMPQAPMSLSVLWGHQQELGVCLTLFQLLFLQKSDLLGVVLMQKYSLPKSASQGQWGCGRSQEGG